MILDYPQIGKNLAKRRKELKLKQYEVCERAEINDKYLSCIETARSIPSLEVFLRLCTALETTPDRILFGTVRQTDYTKDSTILLEKFPELVEDNGTVKALQGWNAHNATNEAAVAESTSYDGAFVTKSFMGGNAPLVQYTVVKDTPHVYLQEESVAIWNEFFSRYSRGADGTLYYQGNAVTAGKHQPSADWYAAK